ncbi:Outer membrane lipoprotein Blc [bioreactor metagenome]|uniref:Outer membrane lipoprotein Blc n=1 Tax=bioreactor metagenome TaxID=1076179 RepID=A0A645IB70_9ZZZZ
MTVPKGVTPWGEFDVDSYMGHWYEVARLERRFERNLTSCSADYLRLPDGTVQVTNRGFNTDSGEWEQAKAVAKFTGDASVGALKVSFIRPFYGGYNVVYVDDAYEHAVVIGDSLDYFWILSRSPQVSDKKYAELLDVAQRNGVDIERVVRIPHGAEFEKSLTSGGIDLETAAGI